MDKDKVYNLVLKYVEEYLEFPPFHISKQEFKRISYAQFTAYTILDLLLNPFLEDKDGMEIIMDYFYYECLLDNMVNKPSYLMVVIIDTINDIIIYLQEEYDK